MDDTWKKIVTAVRKKIGNPSAYDGIIIKTRELYIKDNCLNVEVESGFVRDKLMDNYMAMFNEELSAVLKQPDVRIKLFITTEAFEDNHELLEDVKPAKTTVKKAEQVVETKAAKQIDSKIETTPQVEESELEKIQRDHEKADIKIVSGGLYPKYTFDTFIVGKSNQFAHGISLNVARFQDTQYNPLFLYGGAGLGKTHLMQAIGHHILKSNKKANVIYVTSESFLNEMVNAMQNNKASKFRDKYRSADVLMVDDVQFLSGKEGTQEEFFHTFNHLYQSRKRIVLTSDRKPDEITRLEERLVSRFQSGMVADIQPPDLELRMAILRNSRDISGKQVSNEMIAYIAQKIEGNIRKLEGAFLKVIAVTELTHREISESLIDEALHDMSQASQKKVTIEMVVKTVAEHFKLSVNDFKSKNRSANVAFPRQIAMYICKFLVDAPTTKIGNEFGGRDHSTIIHGIGKIEEMMDKDISFRNEIEGLIQKVKKAV